jgi:hypothetical protein
MINATELIWNTVKTGVVQKCSSKCCCWNTNTTMQVTGNTKDEYCKNAISHKKKIEDNYWTTHRLV